MKRSVCFDEIELRPIDEVPEGMAATWALLRIRPQNANISHRRMPTWEEHLAFFRSKPYLAWYGIIDTSNEKMAGMIYLTDGAIPGHIGSEIGIQLFPDCYGMGIGEAAVQHLMAKHGPRIYRANIAPENGASVTFFNGLGFTLRQMTYDIDFRGFEDA